MADTTTVGTEGLFGTVTDRIVSVATMGWFLELETSDIVPISLFDKGAKHGIYFKGAKHSIDNKGAQHGLFKV